MTAILLKLQDAHQNQLNMPTQNKVREIPNIKFPLCSPCGIRENYLLDISVLHNTHNIINQQSSPKLHYPHKTTDKIITLSDWLHNPHPLPRDQAIPWCKAPTPSHLFGLSSISSHTQVEVNCQNSLSFMNNTGNAKDSEISQKAEIKAKFGITY